MPVQGDQGDQWSQRQSTGHGRSLQGRTWEVDSNLFSIWFFALEYLEGWWLTRVSLSVGQKQTEALVARGWAGGLGEWTGYYWILLLSNMSAPPDSRHWGLESRSLVRSVFLPQCWPCQGWALQNLMVGRGKEPRGFAPFFGTPSLPRFWPTSRHTLFLVGRAGAAVDETPGRKCLLFTFGKEKRPTAKRADSGNRNTRTGGEIWIIKKIEL